MEVIAIVVKDVLGCEQLAQEAQGMLQNAHKDYIASEEYVERLETRSRRLRRAITNTVECASE